MEQNGRCQGSHEDTRGLFIGVYANGTVEQPKNPINLDSLRKTLKARIGVRYSQYGGLDLSLLSFSSFFSFLFFPSFFSFLSSFVALLS